jgi:aminopeptidase N
MLRRRIGDDAFWKSIQAYANAHRLKSVETSDFRRSVETESGRDLERFFYDWTERPGSPVLDVNTSYSPEFKQARVVVKQTQATEPFHFPLTMAFHFPNGTKPVVIEQDVTDKEYTIVVPLPARPARVEVDPDYTLLGEINETKDADAWRAQLLEGSNVPARIRAARHFAKEKTDANRQLLAQAFAGEKFWGVRAELAGQLGEAGGEASRDALIKGMADQDARVRRACLDQLHRFPKDAKAIEAVRNVLKNGDPSYAVESAALKVYAQQGHKDAGALIQPWLSRPSHRDVLRAGALEALAQTNDLATLDTLLDAAKPGHSRTSRTAALGGLIHLTRHAKPSDEQRQRIMKELAGVIEKDYLLLGFGNAMALRDLGTVATPLLPALDKIARDDPSERIRTFARETAEKIRAKPAPAATPPADIEQLRKEIDRLKKEHETLRERLNKYEKAGSK